MQRIDAVVPEITRQIVYPVAEQISRSVLRKLSIYELFTDNLFFITDDESSSDYRSADDKMRVQESRCDIEIVPNYNPADDAFNSFRTKDTEVSRVSPRSLYQDIPIFADKKDHIGLFEKGVPCSVVLNFTMKLKSRELVDTIHTTLFTQAQTSGAIYNYHQVKYDYGLPDFILLALYKMFQLKDFGSNVVEYKDYLRYGSNDHIALVKNRNTKVGVVSIIKTVTDILGKLDFGGDSPDAEKQNKVLDRYTVNFSYVFEFFRPLALQLEYPIMINNQMLPKAMLTRVDSPEYMSEIEKNLKEKNINEHYYNRSQLPSLDRYGCSRYPEEDTWRMPNATYKKFKTDYLFRNIALLAVDEDPVTNELTLTIDITNDIFPMMDVETVEAISTYWSKWDMLDKNGLFSIAIFANGNILESVRLVTTRDPYTVTVKDPLLSKAKIYRFTILQSINIKIMPYKAIYYMIDNHEYFLDILSLNIDYLIKYNYLEKVSDSLGEEGIIAPRKYRTPFLLDDGYSTRAITIGKYVVKPIRPTR